MSRNARRKRRVWEEMRSFVLCVEYKEVWEYPCGFIKGIYKNGQQGKAGNKKCNLMLCNVMTGE